DPHTVAPRRRRCRTAGWCLPIVLPALLRRGLRLVPRLHPRRRDWTPRGAHRRAHRRPRVRRLRPTTGGATWLACVGRRAGCSARLLVTACAWGSADSGSSEPRSRLSTSYSTPASATSRLSASVVASASSDSSPPDEFAHST